MSDAEPAADWEYLIQEDRIHRSVYTSAALFQREMRNIFANTWNSRDTILNSFLRLFFLYHHPAHRPLNARMTILAE